MIIVAEEERWIGCMAQDRSNYAAALASDWGKERA